MLIIYYGILNLFGFLFMGVDKYKAIHQQYRIRERILLAIIWLGGMMGSALGMFVFHHKVKKATFLIAVSSSFIIHLLFYIYVNKLYY